MSNKIQPINYETLIYDASYEICSGETLFSFYERTIEDFYGVCEYQRDAGYDLYNSHTMNGNHFATYYKDNSLIHIYWIECESELNVVSSCTGGKSLPFCEIADNGKYTPSVTQLKSDRANGMGYVVQLSDGSFIIYDGGYNHHAEQLWNTLVEMRGSDKDIVIRAWIITHAHGDHYPCFVGFSERYAERVRLKTLMISPVNTEDAPDKYLNTKVFEDIKRFDGAKILYVHTGMTFNYGSVTLEILFTADELYIAESSRIMGTNAKIDFNSSSIVSRIATNRKSCIFLGDAYNEEALRLVIYYRKHLKSDMCQASHHGLENCSLLVYRHINASILFYPCSEGTYTRVGRELSRNEYVRKALRESKYTKEIIIHDKANETRYLL